MNIMFDLPKKTNSEINDLYFYNISIQKLFGNKRPRNVNVTIISRDSQRSCIKIIRHK